MIERTPPRIESAPGLVWRERKKTWVAYWQARSDLVKRGYAPGAKKLWEGVEPDDIDRLEIAAQCEDLQSAMLDHDFHTVERLGRPIRRHRGRSAGVDDDVVQTSRNDLIERADAIAALDQRGSRGERGAAAGCQGQGDHHEPNGIHGHSPRKTGMRGERSLTLQM